MIQVKRTIYFFMILIIAFGYCKLYSQTVTIYNQSFSDSSGSIPAGWTNTGSGCTWVSNSTNPSTGYSGSSGGRNIFAGTCTGTTEITLSNISTVNYYGISVLWGARKAPAEGTIAFEWFDGSGWNPVSFTDVTNNSTWALVNGGTQISLPAGAAGMANLKLRWRLTNAVDYRIDDVSIIGYATPTKLGISSIVGSSCIQVEVNVPFSVTVESRNANNLPAPVTSNTGVMLSINTGIGTLTGTLTGTILAANSSVVISGVVSNTTQTNLSIHVVPISGMTGLTPGNSSPIIVHAPVDHIAFSSFPSTGNTNIPINAFQILASNPSNDSGGSCYSGSCTLTQASGPAGGLQGTLTSNFSMGVAQFSNVYFNQPGTYTLTATAGSFVVTSTPIVITNAAVTMNEIKIPLYMEGDHSSSNNLFNAFLVEVQNLLPNTTYRYFNSAVFGDNATSTGAGNVIFVNTTGGNFMRTTAPSLSSNYSTFTSDNNGKYRGWFMIEPSSDSRFTAGNNVKYRIFLNDGATGTTAQTILTTTQTIKVLNYTTTGSKGSFFYTTSGVNSPKNFLLFYNGDTSGTQGRPVFISVVESDGLTNSSSDILPGYITNVDGVNGACGFLLPDNLPLGMTVIEERTLSGGLMMSSLSSGDVRSNATSPNGIWPPGISTVNPNNGTTAVGIQPIFILTAVIQNSTTAKEYSLSQNYPNPFNPSTKIKFNIPKASNVKLAVYDVLGKEIAILVNERLNAGEFSVELNGVNMASGVYFYKLIADDYADIKKMILVK